MRCLELLRIRARLVLLSLILFLLCGCSGWSFYGGIYEGLRMREETVHPGAPGDEYMTYPEYEAERKKLLQRDEPRQDAPR